MYSFSLHIIIILVNTIPIVIAILLLVIAVHCLIFFFKNTVFLKNNFIYIYMYYGIHRIWKNLNENIKFYGPVYYLKKMY